MIEILISVFAIKQEKNGSDTMGSEVENSLIFHL